MCPTIGSKPDRQPWRFLAPSINFFQPQIQVAALAYYCVLPSLEEYISLLFLPIHSIKGNYLAGWNFQTFDPPASRGLYLLEKRRETMRIDRVTHLIG